MSTRCESILGSTLDDVAAALVAATHSRPSPVAAPLLASIMKFLGQDELADVFVLLDRIALDALLVVSRKVCSTVQSLPLYARRRSMSLVCIAVTSHRGKLRRILGRFQKKPRPHEVYALTGFEHRDDLKVHFGNDALQERGRLRPIQTVLPSPEACYRFLSHALPISRITELRLNFRPVSSAIANAFQPANDRHGCIERLIIDVNDLRRIEPTTFENLPLLSGSVHHLEFKGRISPQQQSDRFVRNCMRRCVRALKAASKTWAARKVPRGVCDVREDTILEFCFRSDFGEHHEVCQGKWSISRLPEVQLWLNFVSLSSVFLQRFVRASEDCPSDHKVWLFLCGDNLDRLDMSAGENYHASSNARSCRYRGKMGVDVAIRLDLRFMVVIRRSLEETPPNAPFSDRDYQFMKVTHDPTKAYFLT
ncbi:hypothetical protein AAVH_18953 [Aphelenchoides avenae]|nr:hypothetical protein AAVH_18953 [Aphelenchus avenae]